MKKKFYASMMCADFGNLAREAQALEQAGIDVFHVDIMDGRFVPNFGMGLQDAEFLCKTAKIPVDAHLMIMDPGNYAERFAAMGVKIIYVHPEADLHPVRTLQKIADCGALPGIAVNPGTSVESVRELLPLARYVLIMSVNPGFAGQKYLPFVDDKIVRLVALKEKYGFEVVLDGACSEERIAAMGRAGVDGFVLGTSALFGKGRPYAEIVTKLRSI